MPRSLDVPLEYVRLGLRFDRLESGFVDAYTGDKRIRAAVEELRTRGFSRAKLGSQVHAIPFYEALGFTAEGPVYDDAGIPHRDMSLAL